MAQYCLAGKALTVLQGDITQQRVDVIVNAANRSLLGGGGVDGAIHQAAGPQLVEQCRQLNGCDTGDAKATSGYALPARWVIHTVGPVWQGGAQGEDAQLANCYRRSLEVAAERGAATVAFPAISAGAYGFPLARAAGVAVAAVARYLQQPTPIVEVRFVCFSRRAYTRYEQALEAQLRPQA